jgi:hypothetical protein
MTTAEEARMALAAKDDADHQIARLGLCSP